MLIKTCVKNALMTRFYLQKKCKSALKIIVCVLNQV